MNSASAHKDPIYWIALGAGLLFWLGLVFLTGSVAFPAWSIAELKNVLLLVFIFPLLEEYTFRGFLQSVLYKKGWGKKTKSGISAANVVTSIIFAFMHLFSHTLLWAGLTFFPSLLFGFFRDRYGNVTPSIFLHIFYNAGYFLLFGMPGNTAVT